MKAVQRYERTRDLGGYEGSRRIQKSPGSAYTWFQNGSSAQSSIPTFITPHVLYFPYCHITLRFSNKTHTPDLTQFLIFSVVVARSNKYKSAPNGDDQTQTTFSQWLRSFLEGWYNIQMRRYPGEPIAGPLYCFFLFQLILCVLLELNITL